MTHHEPEVITAQVLKREGRNKHYNYAMFIMVFVTCIVVAVGAIVLYVKIDDKVSTIDGKVSVIATRQVSNTVTNDCVARTTNNAVEDVILALVDHDMNKADYKALVTCHVAKTAPTKAK